MVSVRTAIWILLVSRWPCERLSYLFTRALQLRREAQMVSPAMGAARIGTMYFLRANCAQCNMAEVPVVGV